jgi:hypothetical protein
MDSIRLAPNAGPVLLAHVIVDFDRKAAALPSFAAVQAVFPGALQVE